MPGGGTWNPRPCLFLILTGILLFSVATTTMNWVKYVSLRSTFSFDLGLRHNIAFNYAHGRAITYVLDGAWFDLFDHEGPSIFRSNHFSPMRAFLVPHLYQVWPHIVTLFLLQSLLIGLGALPLFWFGSQRTGALSVGLILAFSYLLHPAVLHTAFNDFREIALGLSPALFALYFHAERK
ncbi:MAG: DUF2079 domain-containing protein, partial [Candidatus Methylomirabilis sp.]